MNRLKKLNLHDAIYKPRVDFQVRDADKYPIQDAVRRKTINRLENIQILDLDDLIEMNQIKMPKPRKTLLQKVREWIKKKLGN